MSWLPPSIILSKTFAGQQRVAIQWVKDMGRAVCDSSSSSWSPTQEVTSDMKFTDTLASSKLGFIKRNLKGCPEELKQLAYFAQVSSGLEYVGTALDPVLKQDIDKVEKIQRNVAWFIKGE